MTDQILQTGVEIIPVVDLKHGLVVRARAGDRRSYAPIVTPLSPTADPADVVRGLLAAVPARRLYIADLDAIAGAEPDFAAIRRIAAAAPGVELWVDAGTGTRERARALLRGAPAKLVLGSESQGDAGLLREFVAEAVLSLDFRGADFVGPVVLRDAAALWPDEVIVMTLARVGTGAGPDLDRLAAVRRQAPGIRLYAAGGLRGPEDLELLAGIGVAGVLVASAIHDGRLGRTPGAR